MFHLGFIRTPRTEWALLAVISRYLWLKTAWLGNNSGKDKLALELSLENIQTSLLEIAQ